MNIVAQCTYHAMPVLSRDIPPPLKLAEAT